jgi:hypothetical protein
MSYNRNRAIGDIGRSEKSGKIGVSSFFLFPRTAARSGSQLDMARQILPKARREFRNGTTATLAQPGPV